jgi:hypothetical protein
VPGGISWPLGPTEKTLGPREEKVGQPRFKNLKFHIIWKEMLYLNKKSHIDTAASSV